MGSACHREAVQMMTTIPATTGIIGAMLSKESEIHKRSTSVDTEEEVAEICQFYKDDFNHSILQTQLQVFYTHFSSTQTDNHPQKIDIFDKKNTFCPSLLANCYICRKSYGLLQLILVMPATNASFERTFSALRRIRRT